MNYDEEISILHKKIEMMGRIFAEVFDANQNEIQYVKEYLALIENGQPTKEQASSFNGKWDELRKVGLLRREKLFKDFGTKPPDSPR